MNQVRQFVSRRMRWAVHAKRYAKALYDHLLPARKSYSQNGEDLLLAEQLGSLDLRSGIYIDVGANQPSHLSNTYAFYRRGLSGILIEPDGTNCWLLRRFRRRDIVIQALAGCAPRLCKFNYSLFSVLNSVNPMTESLILRQEYIPQITLDSVLDSVEPKWVYVLTVDTEGHDLEVLRGAERTLQRTLHVCVEFGRGAGKSDLESFMAEHWFHLVASNSLNIVFRNAKPIPGMSETATQSATSQGGSADSGGA